MVPARLVVLGAAVLLVCGSVSNAQIPLGRTGCPKPKGLSVAVTSPSSVALSWQAGDGAVPAACSCYLITIFKDTQPVSSAKSFGANTPSANINGLSPKEAYTLQVRALSRSGFATSDAAELAGVATTVASPRPTPADGGAASGGSPGAWACVAAEGYPVCSAGQAGLCTPITCADMARLGRCDAPYIRIQDWSKHTVTQHCAAQCGGCSGTADPRLADSMAPPQEYCCAFGTGAYFAGPGGAAVAA